MADVAVVGAGPAGAWTAYGLARRGARVRIFDASHPREKPCGGGVTGRALAVVAGAIDVGSLDAVDVRRARFSCGASAVVPLTPADGARALSVASRASFDGGLLAAARAAGAELVPARVTSIGRDAHGFRLETTSGVHRAAWLVGADGANSLVRRAVARPFARRDLSIATGFYARGVTSDEIVIEFVADPPGYIWSFPRPDHLAVGVCAQADAGLSAAALRASTLAWMDTAGIARGAPLTPYSWPIPSLPVDRLATLDLSGPGWLLVGDAAGFVDPITREGIFFALQSAELAVDALLSATPRPDEIYACRARAEIVAELTLAARFKAGFFRPAFVRPLVQALEHSPGIQQVMADLVAGRQGYRGLKSRLARTLEVGLLWKAWKTVRA